MDFQIENEYLRAGFNRKGAECCSLKEKGLEHERIWQADPTIWGRHAPLLFPIVGTLKNKELRHQGQSFAVSRHGFLRDRSCDLLWQKENALCFSLNSDEASLKQYPFPFNIEIEYRITGKSLQNLFRVKNTGESVMAFCLGGHPAFSIPFVKGENPWDYLIELEQAETLFRERLNGEGLYIGEKELVFDNSTILPLGPETFARDALVFKQLKSRKVRLRHKDKSTGLVLDFSDFRHLGLWAKAGAPFVCLEPWIGHSDQADADHDFLNKPDAVRLESGESFFAGFTISLNS